MSLQIKSLSLVIVGLLVLPSVGRGAEHTQDSLETVKQNVASGKGVLVDVRDPIEWRNGHVVGAVALPMSQIERRKIAPEVLGTLPKDRILYTYCVVGMRSRQAADVLEKLGYQVRPLNRVSTN